MAIEAIKYRVWHNINGVSHNHPVSSVDEAKVITARLIAEQVNDDSVEFNAFGLEVFGVIEADEWAEWYDENGDDLETIMDREAGEVKA